MEKSEGRSNAEGKKEGQKHTRHIWKIWILMTMEVIERIERKRNSGMIMNLDLRNYTQFDSTD